MSNDHCARLAEVFVAPCMIFVPVSIDNELNGLVTDRKGCGFDLVGKRGILIVYHENAIFPSGDTDISSRADK